LARTSNITAAATAAATAFSGLNFRSWRTTLERQIAATDGEIDQLVYQLYGLTDAEIKIVEGATGK
jgi:hypothetical protein